MKFTNNKGFSLIECIIVMAIMGILATVALPSYHAYLGQRRLSGSIRQIQFDLMLLRMKSINENKIMAMTFTGDHQYILFNDQNNNGTVESSETSESKTIRPDYFDVAITSIAGYVPKFHSNGTANIGRITCVGQAGTKEIRVNGAGRLKIL
ncbi:MAG: hypothetical protein COX51_00885 [Syntrophobacteraceae bacterium CG23_combo_of_CG06-09_8_20_14_all_50_8]|nr:MAG: hypothetical protein COX51_00885 [Syntrophobacteraceae bacterium CG23_combo_of_CG06-09_8_20_14_all_50_8]